MVALSPGALSLTAKVMPVDWVSKLAVPPVRFFMRS